VRTNEARSARYQNLEVFKIIHIMLMDAARGWLETENAGANVTPACGRIKACREVRA
jgi:hypothetical protein